MSRPQGIRTGESAANKPNPNAAATMAHTPALREARHVRIQGRVFTTNPPFHRHVTTTAGQEDAPHLEEATRSDVESGGSNNQGSKKRRKMRLLWKRLGVVVRRFASSFRGRKVKWSESEPSDEDEVDSKKCNKRHH